MFAVVKDFFVKKSTSIISNIPNLVKYSFNPKNYPNMKLPIPIGIGENGLVVRDFARIENLNITGTAGSGKTNFIRQIIHQGLSSPVDCEFVVIDPHYLEFLDYAKNEKVKLASTYDEIKEVLFNLQEEIYKRYELLKSKGLINFKSLPENSLPYICLIVDDAQYYLEDRLIKHMIKEIVLTTKAVGVKVILSNPRPITEGIMSNCFHTQLAFRYRNEMTSRILFGDNLHYEFPPNNIGRALFQSTGDMKPIEVQTMYFKNEK